VGIRPGRANSAPESVQGLTHDRRRGISAPLGVGWQHHLHHRTLEIMENDRLAPSNPEPLPASRKVTLPAATE